jgi:uncharacterized phage protein (TIGR01671 family)
MNRPIKFRIWDEKYHCWERGLMVYAENIICQGRIFTQFTGLLDKNGKEIWEGDIVKYRYKFDEHGYVQNLKDVIKWNEDCAAFGIGDDWVLFSDYGLSGIEVIGNVFENPELIK